MGRFAAILAAAVIAAGLSACATARQKVIDGAKTVTEKVCEADEQYRLALRKDLWECCGLDSTQSCTDPAQRVKPPTIP